MLHACEVKQIAVLFEGQAAISVGWVNIVGMDNYQTSWLKQRSEVFTIADQEFCGNRFVAHGMISSDLRLQGNLDFQRPSPVK